MRLERVFESCEAEFAVVYGRRRIGKTYLVRQFFQSKPCTFFQVQGLQQGSLKDQLNHFREALSVTFFHSAPLEALESWEAGFSLLQKCLISTRSKKKIVLFFDELPWLVTRRSGFLETLDYYWNSYFSMNPKVIFIAFGSSASWLIKNILYHPGGLHNRCTCEISLAPFTLQETEAFLKSRKINLNRPQILDLYMALGGIPYYLKYVEKGRSAAENIQALFFDASAPLKDEFTKLFFSLFTQAPAYIELVSLIASKKSGRSRAELETLATLSQGGGRLTDRLTQLLQTHFIEKFRPWNKQHGEQYRVVDEFSLFVLQWVHNRNVDSSIPHYWLSQITLPAYHSWAGMAFEAICWKHRSHILKELKIVTTISISSWYQRGTASQSGAQIDLLIDRSDDAITLCEMKYTSQPFAIDKDYASKLQSKIQVVTGLAVSKKTIFLALITQGPLKQNSYSADYVQAHVFSDCFFEE